MTPRCRCTRAPRQSYVTMHHNGGAWELSSNHSLRCMRCLELKAIAIIWGFINKQHEKYIWNKTTNWKSYHQFEDLKNWVGTILILIEIVLYFFGNISRPKCGTVTHFSNAVSIPNATSTSALWYQQCAIDRHLSTMANDFNIPRQRIVQTHNQNANMYLCICIFPKLIHHI